MKDRSRSSDPQAEQDDSTLDLEAIKDLDVDGAAADEARGGTGRSHVADYSPRSHNPVK